MNTLEYFSKIDLTEIDRYVSEGQEENLHLDFKTVDHPDYLNGNKNSDKKNISKILSGFANSAGGIIVWGIKTDKIGGIDVASSKRPIKKLTSFLNYLNRMESDAVSPTVVGVMHKSISIGGDEGYIITYVPESEYAPHMANYADKNYYKRAGDSFVICEHYDIRDMFNRHKAPKLKIQVTQIDAYTSGDKNVRVLIVAIINEGTVIAKFPFINLAINPPYIFDSHGLNGNGYTGGLLPFPPGNAYTKSFRAGNDVVIHPTLPHNIDKITARVPLGTKFPELQIQYTVSAENMIPEEHTYKFIVDKEN